MEVFDLEGAFRGGGIFLIGLPFDRMIFLGDERRWEDAWFFADHFFRIRSGCCSVQASCTHPQVRDATGEDRFLIQTRFKARVLNHISPKTPFQFHHFGAGRVPLFWDDCAIFLARVATSSVI